MKIKDAFEKLKNILKTKTAIRVISVVIVVLALGASVLVTLHFTKNDDVLMHTVAFDTGGGSSVAAREVRHGELVARPGNPTKSGFVFDGWYVYGIPWNFDMNTVTESIVMRAAWREAVEVTFDTGEEIITVPVAKGSVIRESDLPKTYREDLCGWFVGGEPWDFGTPVTEPVRLNAGYFTSLTFDGDLTDFDTLCASLGITLSGADNADIALGLGTAPSDAVDLSKYLEYLPHFNSFLKQNPDLYSYLTSQGELLLAPMPISDEKYSLYINEEWVKILIDGDDFENPDATLIQNMYCAPHVSADAPVVSVEIDGVSTYITKRLAISGNIVDTMNKYVTIGGLGGEQAAKYLQMYVDSAYDIYFGENRSELFLGDGALYDTDELVALVRVAIANVSALGESAVGGIYVDIDDASAVASLMAELFGVENISTALPKMTFTETKITYGGQDEQVKYAVDAFNRMIFEGLVTFDDSIPTLVRYGDGGEYTEMAPIASLRVEKDGTVEYVRLSNALECNTLCTLSLQKSVLSSREKLMSALRLIDALYIGY